MTNTLTTDVVNSCMIPSSVIGESTVNGQLSNARSVNFLSPLKIYREAKANTKVEQNAQVTKLVEEISSIILNEQSINLLKHTGYLRAQIKLGIERSLKVDNSKINACLYDEVGVEEKLKPEIEMALKREINPISIAIYSKQSLNFMLVDE